MEGLDLLMCQSHTEHGEFNGKYLFKFRNISAAGGYELIHTSDTGHTGGA